MTERGEREAGVRCPGCAAGHLRSAFSCLSVAFTCPACGARFDLAALAGQLDDETFSRLERAVARRGSDRV